MIWIFSLTLVILIGLGSYISMIYSLREKDSHELCAEDFEITEIIEREY